MFFLSMNRCELPIHRPNKGMRQKNVLHVGNKIAGWVGQGFHFYGNFPILGKFHHSREIFREGQQVREILGKFSKYP